MSHSLNTYIIGPLLLASPVEIFDHSVDVGRSTLRRSETDDVGAQGAVLCSMQAPLQGGEVAIENIIGRSLLNAMEVTRQVVVSHGRNAVRCHPADGKERSHHAGRCASEHFRSSRSDCTWGDRCPRSGPVELDFEAAKRPLGACVALGVHAECYARVQYSSDSALDRRVRPAPFRP